MIIALVVLVTKIANLTLPLDARQKSIIHTIYLFSVGKHQRNGPERLAICIAIFFTLAKYVFPRVIGAKHNTFIYNAPET